MLCSQISFRFFPTGCYTVSTFLQIPMKKLSLLLGTLGGATAGYLFSNKKLRDQIANAKDGEEAARLLGTHLQKDGKKLAKQMQDFIESEEVQKNITKAKSYAKKTVDDAKKELDGALSAGKKKATKAANTAKNNATKSVKKGTKKAKATAKKSVKTAKKKATSAGKRMKTRVRKLT